MMLQPTAPKGYTKDSPLDNMMKDDKAKQHFDGVNMSDPRQVADILHSFFRCYSDKSSLVRTKPGQSEYFGLFSAVR